VVSRTLGQWTGNLAQRPGVCHPRNAPAKMVPSGDRRAYTDTMTQDPRADETAGQAALRRQIEDPEDHDVSLIEECLGLTPDERLQRLTSWVAFVASAGPIEGLATGGRD